MKRIKSGGRKTEISYSLYYYVKGDYHGGGYGFTCDAEGNVKINEMYDAAVANYERVKDDPEWDHELQTIRNTYWEPSEWKCDCGATVYGGGPGDDFDCNVCGRMYNAFGQRLAPVEQWGYETGEHPADIYNARRSGYHG